MNRTYLRYELLRTFRNRRFFVLALGVPARPLLPDRAPNRHETDLGHTGLSAPLYFMVGLAAFGAMNAMLSSGARIAGERAVGWNRQLRITPLPVRAYFRAKVADRLHDGRPHARGACTCAGVSLGVSLTGSEWVRMTALILVGLLPFAALGIVLGHLLTPDSIGPAMGGMTALFAILGGTWFPITSGALKTSASRCRRTGSCRRPTSPSAAMAGRRPGGRSWRSWTVGGGAAARWAYRRDTQRV